MIKLICAVVILLFAPSKIWAASEKDPDWPCVQRKVVELSAGMMWGGPVLTPETSDWATNPEVSKLVAQLSVRRTSLDQASELIMRFASSLEPEKKQYMLSAAFAGILEKINSERKSIIGGIQRYSRKQRGFADKVRETRKELMTVLKIENPTDADDTKRQELENALNWQTRIYDDRNRSLVYVCEVPVLLEQRIFHIARELANQID